MDHIAIRRLLELAEAGSISVKLEREHLEKCPHCRTLLRAFVDEQMRRRVMNLQRKPQRFDRSA